MRLIFNGNLGEFKDLIESFSLNGNWRSEPNQLSIFENEELKITFRLGDVFLSNKNYEKNSLEDIKFMQAFSESIIKFNKTKKMRAKAV
jgi:hypothetical protein